MSSDTNKLKQLLVEKGASIIGFADLKEIPPQNRHNLNSGISIAVSLDKRIVSQIISGPSEEYLVEYNRINDKLNQLGQIACDFLSNLGAKAIFFPSTIKLHDKDTLNTPLPHKTVATRAGIGWIGKSALLINKKYGAAIRLTSVLTDLTLPTGTSINKSYCGSCQKCVTSCPGKAIRGNNWKLNCERSFIFDAFTCRQTAWALTKQFIGQPLTICGICISVCPWTQKYINE
ncbi:4Fe-4S double cluster binding domain-containing protein [Candidatus Margulisiibacteriota bacterium]